MSWDAVTHKQQVWGYPVALEAASLIYNKKLVTGKVPTQLSELPAFGKELKAQHLQAIVIMWDYKTPYFTGRFSPAPEDTRSRRRPRAMTSTTSEWPTPEPSRV